MLCVLFVITGYLTFAECGPQTNPTIGLEKGATYIFEQTDKSNYMIPINFSYAPDGGHRGGDPVAAHITPPGSSSDCATTMSCPMPMYFAKGGYLGRYSNIEELAPLMGCGDNGLSQYSLAFSNSLRDWVIEGSWQVALKLDVDDMVSDFFYFNDVRIQYCLILMVIILFNIKTCADVILFCFILFCWIWLIRFFHSCQVALRYSTVTEHPYKRKTCLSWASNTKFQVNLIRNVELSRSEEIHFPILSAQLTSFVMYPMTIQFSRTSQNVLKLLTVK